MFKKLTSLILAVALCSSFALNTKAQTTDPLVITTSFGGQSGNPASMYWEYAVQNTTNTDISLDFGSNVNPDVTIDFAFCSQNNCVNGNNISSTEIIPAGQTSYLTIFGSTKTSGTYCDQTKINYNFEGKDYSFGSEVLCPKVEVFVTPQIEKIGRDDGKGNIIWAYNLTNYLDIPISGEIYDTLDSDQTFTGDFCNGANCVNTINSQNMTTVITDLAPQESVFIAIKSKAGTNNQEYCNVASFKVNDFSGESSKVCVTPSFDDKFTASKFGSYNFDTKQIEWSIELENSGTDKVIKLQDIVPAGTTIASVECINNYNTGICNQNIVFDSAELSGEITMKYDDRYIFNVKADVSADGTYCNTANYSGDAIGSTNESCVIVNNKPVVVSKNGFYDQDTGEIIWNIEIDNRGGDINLDFVDNLPIGNTVISTNCQIFVLAPEPIDCTLANNDTVVKGSLEIPTRAFASIRIISKPDVNGEYCNTAKTTISGIESETEKACVTVENISSAVSSTVSLETSSTISSDIISSVISSDAISSQTSSLVSSATVPSSVVVSQGISSANFSLISSEVVSSEIISNTSSNIMSTVSSQAMSSLVSSKTSSNVEAISSVIFSNSQNSVVSSTPVLVSSITSIKVSSSSKTSSTSSSVISSPKTMTPVSNIISKKSALSQLVNLTIVKKLTTIPKFKNGAGLNNATCNGKNVSLTNNKIIKESDLLIQSPNTFAQGLYQLEAKCKGDLEVSVVWENLKTLDGLCYKKFVGGKFVDFPVTKSIVSVGGKQMAMATYTIKDNGPFDNDKTVGNIKDPAGPCDCDPIKTSNDKKQIATVRSGASTNYWIIGLATTVSVAGLFIVYFKKKKVQAKTSSN